MEMTHDMLQTLAQTISTASFHRPFLHCISFNKRLRAVAGRYLPHTHNIEISWRYYVAYGTEQLSPVILHELCHYHLHVQGRGFRERDADFLRLLSTVGAPKYGLPLPSPGRPFRYVLKCTACHTRYNRKRFLDPQKYRCGRCGGSLTSTALS